MNLNQQLDVIVDQIPSCAESGDSSDANLTANPSYSTKWTKSDIICPDNELAKTRCPGSPSVPKPRRRFGQSAEFQTLKTVANRAVLDNIEQASTLDCAGWCGMFMKLGWNQGLRCLMWIVTETVLAQRTLTFNLNRGWTWVCTQDCVAEYGLSFGLDCN